MSMWGWEGQQDGTGSEGRLQKAVTQDSTILKANMEANPCCICREKCSSSCVLFFLVVVAILSSVKKPPPPRSRWNQSASLSFRSSVGKSLREDKRAVEGGRQWKRTAEKDDSALFLHGCFSFVLLFHSSLLSAFLISHSLSSPTPVHVWTERKKPLPSFCSFNPPPRLTSNKKKNPDRKLKWTLTVNLIQTF